MKTGLNLAVSRRDIEDVRRILSTPGTDVDEIDYSGKCPLHIAFEKQSQTLVYMLLKAGADPNRVTKFRTPLMLACQYLSFDDKIVPYLLKLGANPNKSGGGAKHLVYAIKYKAFAAFWALLPVSRMLQEEIYLWSDMERHDDQTPLSAAVPYPQLVGALLNYGADPDFKDGYGQPAIFYAARNNPGDKTSNERAASADILILAGASVICANGRDARDYATPNVKEHLNKALELRQKMRNRVATVIYFALLHRYYCPGERGAIIAKKVFASLCDPNTSL